VTDWRDDRIGSALRGENPTVMARMPAGFAVIGDVQWLPGYSLLLTDDPAVTRLSDLPRRRRLEFLDSTERLASAVEQACAAADEEFRRVNIEILGNTDPYLHAHVWPRYEWEPPALVGRPVWLYSASHWSDPSYRLGPQHEALRTAITEHLLRRDPRTGVVSTGSDPRD
jgi:diadenosine tetraphosphate (Ap4A) HIT family hydrolase